MMAWEQIILVLYEHCGGPVYVKKNGGGYHLQATPFARKEEVLMTS